MPKKKEVVHIIRINDLPLRDGLVDAVVEALGGMTEEVTSPSDEPVPIEDPTLEDKLAFIGSKVADHVAPFLVATLDKATNAEIDKQRVALQDAENAKRTGIAGQVKAVLDHK